MDPKFERTSCCNCGIEFCVPRHFMNARREDGEALYCPNGHSLSYRETTVDRLTRERNLLKQRLAERDDEIAAQERRAAAYRGQVTKLRKRIGGGVCPCCHRTFKQLAQHMKNKHPDFTDEPPDLKVVEGGRA